MYLKILKKDLRRKKTMNIILLIFIMLATLFISGSVNNLVVVLSGIDNFFERSEIDDFIIITMRGDKNADTKNEASIEDFLKHNKYVCEYSTDDILFLSTSNISINDGKNINVSASIMCNSWNIQAQKFFTSDNEEIVSMDDGTIYLPIEVINDNKLQIGDTINIHSNAGYEREFRLVGSFKDALLGSDLMGTLRILVSENDFNQIMEKSALPCGTIFSLKTDNVDELKNSYNNQDFTQLFNGDKNMVKTTYILDMVIAGVLILVSLCLIIISSVMLRFIIVFSINEDYHEIGIMKAIGISDGGIRKLYMAKYVILAIFGTIIGFILSIPFSDMLIKQVSRNIMLNSGTKGIILQIILSILVAGVVILSAYISSGRIKRLTPMDAIRRGNNGERFKRKGIISLKKSHISTTGFLAVNDIINELKKYVALFFTGIIGMWLIIMPANTINTLNSDKVAKWFSILDCDVWIVDDEMLTEHIISGDRASAEEYMTEVSEALEEAGIDVSNVFMEVIYRLRIRKGDKSYRSLSIQGLNTKTEDYMYDEGTPPMYDNEVALAHVTADSIGARVGDTVYITNAGVEKEYIVTAIYQTMNNLGEGIRFYQDTELNYCDATGGFGVQIKLTGKPTDKEIDRAISEIKKIYPNSRVENMVEFISKMIGGISDRLESLKIGILAVVIVINILVVTLMQKMFLIRERGQMGMLKAIGFSDSSIIAWQTKRVSIVLILGILVGVVTGVPFSQVTAGQIFKIMGASHIEFVINPIEIYVIYPVTILIVTIFVCTLMMLRVRNIRIQEINDID